MGAPGQPPAVPTAGAGQDAQEALQRKKQKPAGSRGCLLNRDLEKGDIRARPPVKIDESRNEERDPDDMDPEDRPGDPRLEELASARLNEILSGANPRLPPCHLDMEQRKRMTADADYRPEVSEHSFLNGHFPKNWGMQDSENSVAKLFGGATPPPLHDTYGVRQPLELVGTFLHAQRELPSQLRQSMKTQTRLLTDAAPPALRNTGIVLQDMAKRLEDLEHEAVLSKQETCLLKQRVTEAETFISHLFATGVIPEEALSAPTSTVVKRKRLCPEITERTLGEVIPDRPSSGFAEKAKDPETLIRLSVQQARSQAKWEASVMDEEFRIKRTCQLVRTLEELVRWLRSKGYQEVGCFAPASLHEMDMAHVAEELIQELREQYKLFPKSLRGKHCISLRELPGEEHPMPDPEYRARHMDRKRAHAHDKANAKRERNRGQESRKAFNKKPANIESRAFVASMQRSGPLFPSPCGPPSASSWIPQEGLEKGLLREGRWRPSRRRVRMGAAAPAPGSSHDQKQLPPPSRTSGRSPVHHHERDWLDPPPGAPLHAWHHTSPHSGPSTSSTSLRRGALCSPCPR